MSPRAVFDIAGFQAVWFACALGAARGLAWPGIAAAAVFLAVHLALARYARGAAMIILASGVLGAAIESALVAGGVLRYAAPWPSPAAAPVWIIALWLAFGAALGPMRALLGAAPALKAALAGAVLGPLTYLGGERLGAMTLAEPVWKSAAVLALIWAIGLPALFNLRLRLVGGGDPPEHG